MPSGKNGTEGRQDAQIGTESPEIVPNGVRQTFPIVIAEWHKSAGHVVRVSLDEFKGQPYVNARVWYTDARGEFRPGKNGMGLSVRHLPDLIRALQDAAGRAYTLGLLDNGGDQ